jgi:hypothetical protein
MSSIPVGIRLARSHALDPVDSEELEMECLWLPRPIMIVLSLEHADKRQSYSHTPLEFLKSSQKTCGYCTEVRVRLEY